MSVRIRGASVLLLVLLGGVPVASAAQETVAIGSRVGVPPSGYQGAGRRDPFASLIAAPTPSSAPAAPRAAGLAGIAVADVAVKGIITSGNTWIALLEAPDGKTYLARPQDRLHDGVVRRIDADAVVFLTQAGSGAGAAREVRKGLRPTAGDQ